MIETKTIVSEEIKIVQINNSLLNSIYIFLGDIYPKYDHQELKNNLESAEQIFGLFLDDIKLIGCCYCWKLFFDVYSVGGIGGVAIDHNYRRSGLGKYMLEYVTATLQHYDAFLVWTRKKTFFSRCGFIDFSNGIITEECDSTPMIKPINKKLMNFIPQPKWRRVKF